MHAPPAAELPAERARATAPPRQVQGCLPRRVSLTRGDFHRPAPDLARRREPSRSAFDSKERAILATVQHVARSFTSHADAGGQDRPAARIATNNAPDDPGIAPSRTGSQETQASRTHARCTKLSAPTGPQPERSRPHTSPQGGGDEAAASITSGARPLTHRQ